MHASHLFDWFDLPILTFLTSFAGHSRMFDHLVNALSRLDIFKGIALMSLFWYTWAHGPLNEPIDARDERHRRLIKVLVGTVLIGGLSRGLQLVLQVHQRPLLSNLGLPFPLMEPASHSLDSWNTFQNLNSWNSFPSDHAMFFFALGTGLWSVNRVAGLIAFLWTIVVIDFPRMYLGVHYPSDVFAGVLFGFLGMNAFLKLPLIRFENALNAWRHAHQGLFLALLFFTTDEVGHLLAELRELAHSSAQIIN